MSGSIHQRSVRSTRSPIRRTPDAVAIAANARPRPPGRQRHRKPDLDSHRLWIAIGCRSNVELQQLRYFIAVAETRKFTTAARDLHVAQPSVSKQVRKLETELGAVLLERGRAGVALTDAGAIFLPWARRVLADLDGARSVVAGLFAVEGAEMDGVLRMAAAGVGVAVVPSMVVERGGPLVAVRIVQPTLSRSVGVAFRRDRHHSRAADAFVARLRAFV